MTAVFTLQHTHKPGIFHSTEDPNDRHFIARVKDMTKSYLRQEKTIVVLTIDCGNDIDNQVSNMQE